MALIKTGGAISEIRGSIGGTTFSRGRYGAIARNRTVPVQPNSEKQNAVRQILGDLVSRWGDFDQAVRDGWNLYANGTPMINRLGETIYLSGQNHFIRSSMCRAVAFLDPVAIAPAIFNLGQTDPTITANIADLLAPGSSAISATFDNTLDWASATKGALILYTGIPQNQGVAYYKGPWQYYGDIKGATPTHPTSPSNIFNNNTPDFPAQPDQKIWLAYRLLTQDGRATTLQTLPAQITVAVNP